VHRQLKRLADVLLVDRLLLISSSMLIWLEDRRHVFYVQQRNGWLGEPFKIWKLRTLAMAPADDPACWTCLATDVSPGWGSCCGAHA
jgi:lipopolysaccharide/colanic/teichoic acid biosynthesis glycosyltransferase